MRRLLLLVALVAIAAPAGAQTFAIPPAQLAAPIVVFPGSASQVYAVDGSVSAPSISFASDTDTGFYWPALTGDINLVADGNRQILFFAGGVRLGANVGLGWSGNADPNLAVTDTTMNRTGAGKISLTGTTPMIQFGGTTSSFPALKRNGIRLDFRLGDDSTFADMAAANGVFTTGLFTSAGAMVLSMSSTNPTISSGFGTSPTVPSGNGATTFRVNVGTGGVATSGVVAMGATASTGWNCQVTDMTNNTVTRETASTTTTVTVTAAAAWAASDILVFNCAAY
jgi:hypothetical protein